MLKAHKFKGMIRSKKFKKNIKRNFSLLQAYMYSFLNVSESYMVQMY